MLFLDSADVRDAEVAFATGLVSGITTNPSLLAATGRPVGDVLGALCDVSRGMVFYQLTAETPDARRAEADRILALRPGRIGLKIPARWDNFPMVRDFVAQNVAVGVTAIFSPAQVILACAAGARFVLPYVNRSTRLLGDGPDLVRRMRAVIDSGDSATRILAASVKTPLEAEQTLLAGAHDLTLPLSVLQSLGHHELSEAAIADFAAASRGAE